MHEPGLDLDTIPPVVQDMTFGAGVSTELSVAGLKAMPRTACCRAQLCAQTQQQWL